MARETGIAILLDPKNFISGAQKIINASKGMVRQVGSGVTKIRGGFTKLENSVFSLKGAFASMGAAMALRHLVNVNSEFEQMRASLETLTGSAENANKEFKALGEFAKSTPFTLDQSVNAFIKLQSLGIRPSEERLKSFGNTATAMGKSLSQFIEAVADASTMEFERLKEFGIKARQETSAVNFTFQGTTTKVGKNSKEIIEYLESIGDVQFAGAMEKQMSKLPGILSNLEDSFLRLTGAIGEGGFTDAFGKFALSISEFITKFIDSGRAAQIGKILGSAFIGIGKAIEWATPYVIDFIRILDLAFKTMATLATFTWEGSFDAMFFELSKIGDEMANIFANFGQMQGGAGGETGDTFKIGDSLGKELAETKKQVSETDKAIENAQKTITDFMRDTARETGMLREQERFIRDYNSSLYEQADAYLHLIAVQEADRQMAAAGIALSGTRYKELTEKIYSNLTAQRELNKTIADIQAREEHNTAVKETIEDLEYEIKRQTDLNRAKQIGNEYLADTEATYRALDILRNMNIDSMSAEGQEIIKLTKELDILQNVQNRFNEQDWTAGIRKSVEDYRDSIKNVGRDTYEAMSRAIQGLENVLTDFFTNGKASFEDFSKAIIADINRILIRQMMIAPLLDFLQGPGGTGGMLSNILPAMASGGVFRGPAIVGEGSMAEAAVPLPDGRKIPVDLGDSGNKNVTVNLNITTPNPQAFFESERQIAAQTGNAVARQLQRLK